MENLEVTATEAQQESTATVEKKKKISAKQFFVKLGGSIKEFFRKLMVSLKRRPHNVALCMLLVSFIVYSFALSSMSKTTALIQGSGMGLFEFAIMLFSLLSLVCFLNAFPKRAKVKIVFLVMLFVMLVLVLVCDIMYYIRINEALTRADNPIVLPSDNSRDYVLKAQMISLVHIILLGISILLTATIPLYGKLFQKVKTSIDVEYTEADETVELAEE